MHRSPWLAVAAGLTLVACGQQLTPQQRAVEEQAVGDRLQAWDRAMNNRWMDSLAGVYEHSTSMSVAWPDGHRAEGWEQEQAAEKEFFGNVTYMNLGVQDPIVELLAPTVALVTFHHSTDIMVAGTRQPVTSGQVMQVWIKDPADHLWKIHASEISNAPPAPAAAAPARRH